MDNKRYDQLIADLRSDYRPQREWGEGRGVLMVVGHFLVGIAGGTWVLSALYGVSAGLILAYVLAALGALAHLLFLGRPERALGMARHVRTSWISRGFVGLSLFLIGASVHFLGALSGIHSTALTWASQAVALVGALVMIGYMGFCYTASKAIPFWHSPLHPALYIAYAARGGIAGLLVVTAALGSAAPTDRLLLLWIVVTATVCLLVGLEIHGAWSGGSVAAKWSVRDLLKGRLALTFYGGTLAVGVIVPALLLGNTNAHSPTIMALLGVASAAGDFFMKLSTVKAGVYRPLYLPARHRA